MYSGWRLRVHHILGISSISASKMVTHPNIPCAARADEPAALLDHEQGEYTPLMSEQAV